MFGIRLQHLIGTAAAVLAVVGSAPAAAAGPSPPTKQNGVWQYTVQDPGKSPGNPGKVGKKSGGTTTANPAANCGAASTSCGINCVWVCNGPNNATTVTPQDLLQQLLDKLKPTTPKILTAPLPKTPAQSWCGQGARCGYVGWPEWFWLDPATAGPLHRRLAVGAVWVELTASAQQLTIDSGAGAAKVCPGTGTAYTTGATGSSSCSYTYADSSAQQPGTAYTVTANVQWGGTWRGSGGTGGVLPPIPVTSQFLIRVAEAQALVNGS